MLYIVVWNKTLYCLLQNYTTFAVSPTRREGHENVYGMRNRRRNGRRNVYASLEVWMLWLGCLSITTVHGACDRPRCLRVVNTGIHSPHPLDLRGVIKPPKPPILLNFEHLKHLGPCRRRLLSSLEQKTMDPNSTIPLAKAAPFLAEVIMYLSSSSVIVAKCSKSCAACEIRLQFCIARANESGHLSKKKDVSFEIRL